MEEKINYLIQLYNDIIKGIDKILSYSGEVVGTDTLDFEIQINKKLVDYRNNAYSMIEYLSNLKSSASSYESAYNTYMSIIRGRSDA